jgi:hypothetical protein
MRWKIIFVNGGVVMVVAVLTYFLLAASLSSVVANPAEQKRELARALRGASSQLALDGLRMERWLAQQVVTRPVREVYQGGTAAARSDWATSAANALRDRAAAEPDFARMAPALVLFVDERGVGIGRNGSALMRGDRVAESYPGLASALESGLTRSDVWIHRERQEQMLVSYAPVRDERGRILGALVLGTPLNDERLGRTSELTSGHSLAFLHVQGEGATVVAASGPGASQAKAPAVTQMALQSLSGNNPVFTAGPIEDRLYGAIRLDGYPEASGAIVASVPASRVGSVGALLWPVFAVGALGVALVVVGGVLLGNYVSRPVAELEKGLLLVISGNQNLRFELEHDELGGLASRINTLLNTLLGVAEDTTDAQGRAPAASPPRSFDDALAVDESAITQARDVPGGEALAALPPERYYAELYESYVALKQQLGEPVDHITAEAFRSRIRATEEELRGKYGRTVRYGVELKDGAIVLVAVPLPDLVS